MTVLTDQFAQTILPWLGGLIGTLFLLSTGLTVRFWRESKRSPYYFLRRQAEQNMQSYSLASIGLAVTLLFVGTYAWQGPEDHVLRVAAMTNAKPIAAVEELQSELLLVEEEIVEEPLPEVVVLQGLTFADLPVASERSATQSVLTFDISADEVTEVSSSSDIASNLYREPTLPLEYDQYEPTIDLADETALTALVFCTDVDDDMRPVNPQRLFKEGSFTIYATFEYAEMQDGMSWSWVWRKDGEVVDGGNGVWSYGDEGPGYVYLNPHDGFQPGQYSVDIWVNGEMMTTSNLFVTTNIAANN